MLFSPLIFSPSFGLICRKLVPPVIVFEVVTTSEYLWDDDTWVARQTTAHSVWGHRFAPGAGH